MTHAKSSVTSGISATSVAMPNVHTPRRVFHCTPTLVFLDLDDTLFLHWDGLDHQVAQSYEEATVRALCDQGVYLPDGYVLEKLYQSYREHGMPLVGVSQEWDLDHDQLHIEAHDIALDRHVRPQFKQKSEPYVEYYIKLKARMRAAIDLGMQFALLTHGSSRWAHEIPELIGVHEEIPFRRGIDAFDFKQKNKDAALFPEFLRAALFRGMFDSVVKVDDQQRNLILAGDVGLQPVWVHGQNPNHWPDKPDRAHVFEDLLQCLDAVIATRRLSLEKLDKPGIKRNLRS